MKAQKAIMCLLADVLAAVSVLSAVQLPLCAEDSDFAAVSISTVTAAEDGSFETYVVLDALPKTGLCAMEFAVTYDVSVLSISEVELLYDTGADEMEAAIDKHLAGSVFSYEDIGGEIQVRWATALKNSDYWLKEERQFLRISGHVNTDLRGACYPMRIVPPTVPEGQTSAITAGYVDANGNSHYCDVKQTDGAVWTVIDESGATLYGDVNMNGALEISDVIIGFRLMLEEEQTLGAAAYANADCERDGVLTMSDVSLMLHLLECQAEGIAIRAAG